MTAIEHLKSIFSDLLAMNISTRCTITDCIREPNVLFINIKKPNHIYYICVVCYDIVRKPTND